jgi:hypothetical protein
LRGALRSGHDWRGQCFSADANSNTNGHSHSYSHSYGNAYGDPNSHANCNPDNNAIGHATAYTDGDADDFTDTGWKNSPDTAAASDTTSAPLTP